MGENAATYYFTQGVLGVTVVVLLYVCGKLYNKTETQQKRIDDLQDLRLADSKEITKEVTQIIQSNAESNRILGEKIEIVKQRGNL